MSDNLAVLFQLTGVGVVQLDLLTWRCLRVNRAFCKALGYSEAELIQKTYLELSHPDDREQLHRYLTERSDAAKAGELGGEPLALRYLGKGGETVWLELHPDQPTNLQGAETPRSPPVLVVHDVTAYKRREAALRASDEGYRTLFGAIDEGFFVSEMLFDEFGKPVDYRLLEVNPAFEKILGLPGAAGKTARELVPDLEEHWVSIYGQVALTGESVRFTNRLEALDGWFDVYAFRLGGDASRKVAVLFSDVTARRRAEEALLESQQNLEAALSLAEMGIWRFNVLSGSLKFDKNARRIFGLPQEGEIGIEAFMELLHPDDRDGLGALIAQATLAAKAARAGALGADYNAKHEAEYRILRPTPGQPEGQVRWILGRGGLVRKPTSAAFEIVGASFDVTARKGTEAALRELTETLEQRVAARTAELRDSERRFFGAFNAGPVATCISSLNKELFLEVNEMFVQLTGYARDDVIGKSASGLGMWSSPDDQQMLRGAQREGHGFQSLELKLRTKAGEVKEVLMSAEVIPLGTQQGYLKMFYDITERKRTEEQLYGALQEVMSDTSWFSHKVLERLAQVRSGEAKAAPHTALSRRERQVVEQLAKGLDNEAIAAELGLATQTVRNYISTVYDKIGVRSRAEAVVWARERGIVGR